MDTEEYGKQMRILDIMTRLTEGQVINKKAAANQYGVNERTIQRDIEVIRTYFSERETVRGKRKDIIYNRSLNGYICACEKENELTDEEALAVCKILLESRAFTREEMYQILDKIIKSDIATERRQEVQELILNEKHYYIPLKHEKPLLTAIWDIGTAIRKQRLMKIDYSRLDGKNVKRRIKPVGIMFSEFYFYLIAFHHDSESAAKFEVDELHPTIYRIDRINRYTIETEHFQMPYGNRFEESQFRQRVQFMYGGELVKLKFIYKGTSIEAIQDRFPTANCELNDNGTYTVTVEVFGSEGVDMWVRSQGDKIKII
ncbi:MAG: WYL domain-containing protein [Lachnospiraceae bacterium]|nr:WYL domain-containing protein [Lachnospiraceae bacterium]